MEQNYKVVYSVSPQDLEKRLNDFGADFKFIQAFFAPGTGFMAVMERINRQNPGQ